MRFRILFLALAALAFIPLAAAQEKRLELQDLIEEARRGNPEILAAQKRYEASRQRPSQDSSLPDPTLSVGYASNGNPLPGAGLGTEPTSNIGFSLTQEFPYPGKRRLRGEISSKGADAEGQQYRMVERDVIVRLSQAFYRLQHTYPELEVLGRNHALLETLLHIIEARYASGLGTQQEAFKTQTELSILETKRIQVERERRARQAEINSLLNRAAGTPIAEPIEPHVHKIAMTLDEIKARGIDTSPELLRDQKMAERSELALNLARKDIYPDYSVTGGYYYMGNMPPMYQLRADIRLPLYFGRKQRAEVTEQAQRVAGTHMKNFSFRPLWLSRAASAVLVGKIHSEENHPISRILIKLYQPVCEWALRWKWLVLAGAVAMVALTAPLFLRLGSEFMPPLDEGTLLYMPSTLPGISVTQAQRLMQTQDRIIHQFPEVATVLGKAGRAETSTDPAPLSMLRH